MEKTRIDDILMSNIRGCCVDFRRGPARQKNNVSCYFKCDCAVQAMKNIMNDLIEHIGKKNEVALLKRLISIFTDPGDVVIDPCFGSGATARACKELGRSFYGFEINKEFYTRAVNEMVNPANYVEQKLGIKKLF